MHCVPSAPRELHLSPLLVLTSVNCVLFHVSHVVHWGSGQFESMKRRHTLIDLTWSSLHLHTEALASSLQTGDHARCKYSGIWKYFNVSQLTASNLKRCPFTRIRWAWVSQACRCFLLPKYCPGGTKIFQYFTWRVFKSIFSRRMVQSALQVGSYAEGNQTARKCCKSTYVELHKLNKTWYQRHGIAQDPLGWKIWENHRPTVTLNESMNMVLACFCMWFCVCIVFYILFFICLTFQHLICSLVLIFPPSSQ